MILRLFFCSNAFRFFLLAHIIYHHHDRGVSGVLSHELRVFLFRWPAREEGEELRIRKIWGGWGWICS